MVKKIKKRNRKIKQLIGFINNNTSFVLVSLIYVFFMLMIITWGIPNNSHPFNYHMDEWHQLQAVKEVFKSGSSNVPGAAHGPIFQFLLTGIYLVPFYILGIINPLMIKGGLDAIDEQTKLFIILRLNTLIFGVLTLYLINKIAKVFLKIKPIIPLLLFTFTPIWMALSNYFKYDIALVFWITSSIYFSLRYFKDNSIKNFIFVGISCGLALATKISAVPILPILILSYFLLTGNIKKKLKILIYGLVTFFVTFLIFGIPDVILGFADYGDYLSSNLTTSVTTENLLIDKNWFIYLLFQIFPSNFGNIFFLIFIISLIIMLIIVWKALINKKIKKYRIELFLLLSLVLFFASLLPLRIWANGNKLLVILPFAVLISSIFLQRFIRLTFINKKIILTILVVSLFFQIVQSSVFMLMKLEKDVRLESSEWIKINIMKGSVIGIENIPIYQLLPDIVIKEFYQKEKTPNKETNFYFKVIDSQTKDLPKIIVITFAELEGKFYKKSEKKDLLQRLKKENYSERKVFKSDILYYLFKNEIDMFLSGLIPIPTITIYEKRI